MMAKDLVSGILGAVELGANVAGVPFAAGAALILKEIVDTCDQLRIHKVSETYSLTSVSAYIDCRRRLELSETNASSSHSCSMTTPGPTSTPNC
jgi:hypothetical protein